MTASYVLVTSAAVVSVGALVMLVVLPRVVSGADVGARVRATVANSAAALGAIAARSGGLPTAADLEARLARDGASPVCDQQVQLEPGQARAAGTGVAVPCVEGERDDAAPMSLMVLLAPDDKVVTSSYPARYPAGASLAELLLPVRSLDDVKRAGAGGPVGKSGQGSVLWAVAPVAPATATKLREATPLGYVYVQVPASARIAGPSARDLLGLLLPWSAQPGGGASELGRAVPLLQLCMLLLLVTVPVGVVFGLLGTSRLVRRLRRLASTTVMVAEGDFEHRVPVTGGDEVAQLERNFNRMAERLSAAMATERQLADASARHAERSRIARELHDSISQDLFSLAMLAGGLRRALPAGSPLRAGVEAIESTASGAMQEMQALLLELRPVALEDAGLLPALEELCGAYRARFGVAVETDLEEMELDPPVEHAVLRIAQEALANAVKHGDPRRIALRLAAAYRQVEMDVVDDGRGFDPDAAAAGRRGLGLELMRERVGELGGTLRLESRPNTGTRLRVLLPRGRA